MEFLETPRKIKKLRKQLFMRQYELSSENITTAFISMLELGKRNLTKHTAEKIAAKLNEKAAKIGVELNIDGEYLMCSPQEEAEKYCLKKLEKAKTIDETKELISICKKYKLDGAESKIRRFIGDKLFDEKKYDEAYEEYFYAIDLCKNTSDKREQPYLYNRCGRCKINRLKYREALFLFERAVHYSRIYNESEIRQFSLYNTALCYKKLDDFETALNRLDDFFEIVDKENILEVYICALILKGVCYKESGKLDDALNVYDSILLEITSLTPHYLGMVYTNIAETYLEKKDFLQSIEYFNKAQKIRNEQDKFGLPITMVEKAQVYFRQGFYEDAIVMIDLALEAAEQYCNRECLLRGYTVLKKIYITTNDTKRLKVVYERLVELLKESGKENELAKVTNALALLHLNDNDAEAAKKSLEIAQAVCSEKVNVNI